MLVSNEKRTDNSVCALAHDYKYGLMFVRACARAKSAEWIDVRACV